MIATKWQVPEKSFSSEARCHHEIQENKTLREKTIVGNKQQNYQ
jgi:hypothetical protein